MTRLPTEIAVDTIGADAYRIPTGVQRALGYITGSDYVPWPASERDRFGERFVPINQSGQLNIWAQSSIVDVETGASTLENAIAIAKRRHEAQLHTTIYIEGSRLGEARTAVADADLAGWVWYLVANWNLSEAEARSLIGGDIIGFQYASPSSNPHTLMPGSRLTLAEANADLSVVLSSWLAPAKPKPKPRPKPKRKPHPKVQGATAGAVLTAAIIAALKAAGVHITAGELSGIEAIGALLAGTVTPAKKAAGS